MAEPDHEQLADQLESESDAMERHLRELRDEVDETRADWERKRADPSVPGAPPADTGGQEPEVDASAVVHPQLPLVAGDSAKIS